MLDALNTMVTRCHFVLNGFMLLGILHIVIPIYKLVAKKFGASPVKTPPIERQPVKTPTEKGRTPEDIYNYQKYEIPIVDIPVIEMPAIDILDKKAKLNSIKEKEGAKKHISET